ncbi:DHS-like NAD/FAD-binding domain-containing protein [Dactylonectria macrodidyma]|uniref:DHS-like NAD/FAD-binding domain-containing protein n=1 Tax=Dactylonectria macrodidyma TaxID=307937 RepID=A0A9P9FQT8_9HYPO|nr:DHS-like NAD/FAD-binding domain-containing protein [Dactylonectria macrodidyma]
MDTSSPVSAQTDSAFSSPLSNLSKTPSLPSSPVMPDPTNRYPSPSSTASGTQSPVKLGEPIYDDDLRRKLDSATDDGPPPAKRRKMTPPKERTTEYLDLTKPDSEASPEDKRRMERLVTALRKKKKIVVIAGAGISVSAGIPDFRSSTGMFATVKNQHKLKGSGKHLFDASVYKHDASTESFHAMVREMAQKTKSAKPTPFHHLLASLAQEGRLLRLYSQNIDCIDTSMEPLATNVPLNTKGPWPVTIQLHGGLEKMVCTKCGKLETFNGEVFDGPEAPLCRTCEVDDEVRTAHAGKRSHGIGRLRPRFVLYNEYNPDEEAIGNVSSADLKTRPDAVLVVGTTLKVPGTRRLVKELCQVTRGRRNGLTAWINVDSEPKGADFKDCWDIVVRSKCDNVARLAALPPWDCTIGDDYLLSQEEHLESQERLSKSTFAVNIPFHHTDSEDESLAAKPRQVEQAQGIPTPTASPKLGPAKRTTKTKQSKIAFNVKQPKTDKPVKATKPRARKPKQPAKVKPPKNTVMQTFKTGKNLDSQHTRKKSQDNFFNPESSESKTDDFSSGRSTPTMPECQMGDTISPKSAPASLRGLIHM